nr:hypothetical protein [Tanacetum cinerariifolium]
MEKKTLLKNMPYDEVFRSDLRPPIRASTSLKILFEQEDAGREQEHSKQSEKKPQALKEAADLAGWELKKTTNGADEKLVGMEMRINDVLSSLKIGVQDVRMIEIKRIGGENSENPLSDLKKLEKQILMDVFNDQDITNSSISSGKNTMRQMLHRKKLLIVLDDVNDTKQLEAYVVHLTGLSWEAESSLPHEIRKYAFGKEISIEEYKNLLGEVVKYTDGLFLTIKVLGSFLCGQDELEWKDALERLKTIPLEATMEKLEISCLEADYKEIFLDISCLLEGWVLDMHDHIQEMGRHIVRRLHLDEPRRHSRLWIDDEIEDILANDLIILLDLNYMTAISCNFRKVGTKRLFISLDFLSTLIVTLSSSEFISLLSSLFNHNACVAAADAAMNSDSHDDSATVACFCVLQLIGDSP